MTVVDLVLVMSNIFYTPPYTYIYLITVAFNAAFYSITTIS